MPKDNRTMLVTSALPYANGPIHLGHLVEYIQTDIWVRFRRMQGHGVYYVCADDTHGTPIMLRAEAEGIAPETLIERMHAEHGRDFSGFLIEFDNYYTTHSPETRELAHAIYGQLQQADLIARRSIEQLYDPAREMFLPDRFVKGECPKCGARDQYGDACEVCGATYTPAELHNPYSAISGATPVRRESEHYFFRLSDPACVEFLRAWTRSGTLQNEAANKLDEWFEAGLSDWDISRDAPYFGFEIPGAPGKYFYVWLDAPIGYLGSFKNLCNRTGLDFDAYWQQDSSAEVYHFIGKDILYFHALFWPAMLKFSGYRTPTKIFAHGFLTVNGEKMSKSRGTFINAHSYLQQGLNPEWLRYYFAAKLNSGMGDIDLNLDDFVARVNSDLVGKYVNIASRAAGFINNHFHGELKFAAAISSDLLAGANDSGDVVAGLFAEREFSQAVREIMKLADGINTEFDHAAPWKLAKESGATAELQAICSRTLHGFYVLSILLAPILPVTSRRVARELFGMDRDFCWADLQVLPERINAFSHLMTRVEERQITALQEANRAGLEAAASK